MTEERKTDEGFRDFRRDHRGFPIIGGSAIVDVVNTAVDSGTWTPIPMPANIACKQLVVAERGEGVWKLSASSDGSIYFTVHAPLAIEMAAVPEQVLFYAQSAGATGTLEILLVD